MVARAGNGLDDMRQMAQGLLKPGGIKRLLIANRNGQRILDVGDGPGRDRSNAEAATLAELALSAWSLGDKWLGELPESCELLSANWQVCIRNDPPFVVALWYDRGQGKTFLPVNEEAMKELLTALQEELT